MLHTIALTLHMNTICHNLFTITVRCPKVCFVSLLTNSYSANHCTEEKCDHCAYFSRSWFLETGSIRIDEVSDRNKWTLRKVSCYKLPCYYRCFPLFPKHAGLKNSSSCPTRLIYFIHSHSVKLVRKRMSNSYSSGSVWWDLSKKLMLVIRVIT